MGALRQIAMRVRCCSVCCRGWRGPTQVAPDKQAVILARALAYDDNLRTRAGDSLVVAVVFKAGQGGSESAADAHGARLQGARRRQGAEPAAARRQARLQRQRGAARRGVEPGHRRALRLPRARSRSGRHSRGEPARSHPDHRVARGPADLGLSLGVFIFDGKTTITVNLPASKEEGAAFSSELLRLARVIR